MKGVKVWQKKRKVFSDDLSMVSQRQEIILCPAWTVFLTDLHILMRTFMKNWRKSSSWAVSYTHLSSIVVGMKLVKEGKADAFVSAGSSGAILVGGQVIVGRIKGVDRAPLAPLIPTEKGDVYKRQVMPCIRYGF